MQKSITPTLTTAASQMSYNIDFFSKLREVTMQRYFNELNFQKGQAFPMREEANGTFILQEAVRKKRNATDEAKETLVEL